MGSLLRYIRQSRISGLSCVKLRGRFGIICLGLLICGISGTELLVFPVADQLDEAMALISPTRTPSVHFGANRASD